MPCFNAFKIPSLIQQLNCAIMMKSKLTFYIIKRTNVNFASVENKVLNCFVFLHLFRAKLNRFILIIDELYKDNWTSRCTRRPVLKIMIKKHVVFVFSGIITVICLCRKITVTQDDTATCRVLRRTQWTSTIKWANKINKNNHRAYAFLQKKRVITRERDWLFVCVLTAGIIKFNLDPSGSRTCWLSNEEAELSDRMLQRWLGWTDHLQQSGICRFTAEIRFPLWSVNYSGFNWMIGKQTIVKFLLNIINRKCSQHCLWKQGAFRGEQAYFCIFSIQLVSATVWNTLRYNYYVHKPPIG